MPLMETLATVIGIPITKILVKRCLGETSASLGEGLISVIGSKIASADQQREAARLFQTLAGRVIARIAPVFEAYEVADEVNVDSVAFELGKVLEQNATAELFT